MMNLRSAVNKQGHYVTQILHFSGGNKRTFEEVNTSTIKQGEFTKFNLKDGRLIMVNTANIDLVEVFKKDEKNIANPPF